MTTADIYARWAEREAESLSPRYAEWARAIADDGPLLALIDRLPRAKRQPNLVFASARWAGVPTDPWDDVRDRIIGDWDAVERVALVRATQTNEPARCATLLPVLSRIDGPIALIEVGASAGLCLLPDRYGYRFRTPTAERLLGPDDGSGVILDCEVDDAWLPERMPRVVWRRGIDLHPLDVTDPDDLRWLETLIWPGEEDRLDRLHSAADILAADPPAIVRGDLVDELSRAAAEAPPEATLVVLHSAVLGYLPADRRALAVETIRATGAVWLANEGLGVLADLDAELPADAGADGSFLLRRDGVALAETGPHGGYFRALG